MSALLSSGSVRRSAPALAFGIVFGICLGVWLSAAKAADADSNCDETEPRLAEGPRPAELDRSSGTAPEMTATSSLLPQALTLAEMVARMPKVGFFFTLL
jgi:hypothetical protein